MNDVNATILLVEDNEDDIFALKRAQKRANIPNPLQVLTDGQQALDYLAGAGAYADRQRFPIPYLMLLDLKLPYVDGFEILTWMRQQPVFDSVIVVVLTSSAETKDYEKAYALGARSYLVKPPTPQKLLDALDSMKSGQAPQGHSATGSALHC